MKPTIELNEVDFRLLRDLVQVEFGIVTRDDRRKSFEVKLAPRLERLGFRSFSEYFRHLRYKDPGGRELVRMVTLLTNNETYFFREDTQLNTFQERVLPLVKRNKLAEGEKKLTIVSAGCSTGEEVYTLAIKVHESGLFLYDWAVQITGVDISEHAIQTAKRGVYYASSFRTTDANGLLRYFRPIDEGGYEVKPSIRAMTSFVHANLAKPTVRNHLYGADVIFCRNVLIYFSEDRVRGAVGDFHQSLNPGGYLFLGHSETLSGVFEEFQAERYPGTIAYVKNRGDNAK